MTAKLIVIEGLDGSGKETQTHLLEDSLSTRGFKVGSISFPRYGSPSAAPLEQYLHGGYGQNANDVNAYAASSMFAIDRVASYLCEWKPLLQTCDFFIADRYTTSNAIHQLSKLPECDWESFSEWLFDYEFGKLCLPKPNIVVYLRLDLATSQALLKKRYGGDASKRDVHERDLSYLERSQQAAEWCCEHFGWTAIECARDGQLRDRLEVQAEIAMKLGL